MIVNKSGNYIFLEGAHGIGKTTFCSEFAAKDKSIINVGTYTFIVKDQSVGPSYRVQPEVFFDWLLMRASTLITGKPARKEEHNYPTLVEQVSKLLEECSRYFFSKKQHGVIFIDGLNEAQLADIDCFKKFIGLFPLKLPQSITVILTAPNMNNLGVIIGSLVKRQNVISLPPLTQEVSLEYCWHQILGDKAKPALIAQICEKANGHPLYLRYLIEYVNNSQDDCMLDSFPVLSGEIEEYYELIWSALFVDEDAVYFLAVIARLRWGINKIELINMFTSEEQKVFIQVFNRVRHLLLNDSLTTIYHSSFSEFLISKTSALDLAIHQRIANYCLLKSDVDYFLLNVVFHFLKSSDADNLRAINHCTQDWVDQCVFNAVEPDTLLLDIEEVLKAAVNIGSTSEIFRILLLLQRVGFRYNNLFAQSASLIAEALISLKRPHEALKYVIRLNTLIVDPNEALDIALSLIKNDYQDEAFDVLRLLQKRVVNNYDIIFEGVDLHDLVYIFRLHLQTALFMRLAQGGGRREHITSILSFLRKILAECIDPESPDLPRKIFGQVNSLTTSYFLCFHDTYPDLAKIRELTSEVSAEGFLEYIIWVLIDVNDTLEKYNLSRNISSLSRLFSDIEELIRAGNSFDQQLIPAVIDILIVLGAPLSVVRVVASRKSDLKKPDIFGIIANNGVDIDFSNVHKMAMDWRTNAFLSDDLDCLLVGDFHENRWFSSLEKMIVALFWCEGKARRAKSDMDNNLLSQVFEVFKTRVLRSLNFTLSERIKWKNSYAIPENIFPFLYEQITSILIDCYPEELPAFLHDLIEGVDNQLGLYTEGFREVVFSVIKKLTRQEIDNPLSDSIFELLQIWKEHVINGVENRHELVPELLKMIPLFVKVEAHEEAENLYRLMLGVSMGPTWYKEDQLGLMVTVLRNIPASDILGNTLPQIAAYLERASGEMTFQRFIRYEKMSFIGELFRRGQFANGCRYFKLQTCGDISELMLEAQSGVVDKPDVMTSMRYLGGALDEQHAIIEIVRNLTGLDWRLRWALLDIFLCGDERHLEDYATEYAKIINDINSSVVTSEIIYRTEVLVEADIHPSHRREFLNVFRRELNLEYHSVFSRVWSHELNSELQESVDNLNVKTESNVTDVTSVDRDSLFSPGLFGKSSAIEDANRELERAEAQLARRNFREAKVLAVKSLHILQHGGWSIWGNLSRAADRAEIMLREQTTDGLELVRTYASLIISEQYTPKWKIAEHLVEKSFDLLTMEDRFLVLKNAIDHVRLMVGSAANEIERFAFLNNVPIPENGKMEVFNLILWVIDHPKWTRREKAASMIEWLIRSSDDYFPEAVKVAFSMVPNYSADVICGILDYISRREVLPFWNKILPLLEVDSILNNCEHTSRLATLYNIANRAGKAGSSTARDVANRILQKFRSVAIDLDISDESTNLPSWAECISEDWMHLNDLGFVNSEVFALLQEKLNVACSPIDIDTLWMIERKVSDSFRERERKTLNRWESKVRFSLNVSLFSYASQKNFTIIEHVLRVYNPALPEANLSLGFKSPAHIIKKAITDHNNCLDLISYNDSLFLHYYEVVQAEEVSDFLFVEVLAVVIPASLRDGRRIPRLSNAFHSRELPIFKSSTLSHETCCHLRPKSAFFGAFTPAFPLPAFKQLIGAKDSDFDRQTWRMGRSNDIRNMGLPIQEGCLLSVKRNAIRLPEAFKMAWIIRVNGKQVKIVDVQGNHLS